MKKNFYITTTLPYINAEPHIGFAMEIVRADIIARFKREQGFEVFFNTGVDEHGQKIWKKSLKEKKSPQEYVDEYAPKFGHLREALNLSTTNFIRTTDIQHIDATKEFWKRCVKNGDIYKKFYKIKYCVGCELEKTESELLNGKCPLHLNSDIEIIEEENYFFRFSKYQNRLLELYEKHPDFVLPAFRLKEIKEFVKRGLEDFSISRLSSKMPWGVPVPGDTEHIMYVWFDALVNYVSAIGWPRFEDKFNLWWPVVQYCGKDNLRQQAAMWQAMLMSANLPLSRQIIVNGFITVDGQKMSKSLGNVIDPVKLAKDYGVDSLRYFIGRELTTFEDSDFTMKRFKEAYNANLANGLGNLASRILKMSSLYITNPFNISKTPLPFEFVDYLEKYEINKAFDFVWDKISEADALIQKTEPFKLVKTDKNKAIEIIEELLVKLERIADMLEFIIPSTATTIKGLIKENKFPSKPLFPRKD